MARKKTSAPVKPKGKSPRAQSKTKPTDPGKTGYGSAEEAAAEHFMWTIGASSIDGYEPRYVTEAAAMSYAAVWACVSIISDSLAMSECNVFARKDGGGWNKLDEATEDIAWVLNMEPNTEMKAIDFRAVLHADALLNGNGYARIERWPDGKVRYLWHIEPKRVELTRIEGGLWYLVDNGRGNDRSVIRPENMFHIKGPSPDGYVGYSILSIARESILLGKSMEGYGKTFFGRGPMPGGILEMPGNVKQQERDDTRKSFERTYGGAKNAGRVVALSGGMKFTQASIANKDAEFIESREFQIEEVCRWFRIPPSKLGVMSKTSYSSQVQAATEFVQYCLMPWARQFEAEADIKLFGAINRGKKTTKLNLRALMQGDPETHSKTLTSHVNAGIMTPNEARDEIDMNPNPDGGVLMVQGAMTTLKMAQEPPEPPPAPASPPQDGNEPEQDDDEPTQEPRKPTQNAARVQQIENVHAKLFCGKFTALLRIEADKARRADSKDKLKEHCDELYGAKNSTHVASEVRDIVDAVAVALGREDGKAGTAAQTIGNEFDSESRRALMKDCSAAVDKPEWQERPARMAKRAMAICLEVL